MAPKPPRRRGDPSGGPPDPPTAEQSTRPGIAGTKSSSSPSAGSMQNSSSTPATSSPRHAGTRTPNPSSSSSSTRGSELARRVLSNTTSEAGTSSNPGRYVPPHRRVAEAASGPVEEFPKLSGSSQPKPSSNTAPNAPASKEQQPKSGAEQPASTTTAPRPSEQRPQPPSSLQTGHTGGTISGRPPGFKDLIGKKKVQQPKASKGKEPEKPVLKDAPTPEPKQNWNLFSNQGQPSAAAQVSSQGSALSVSAGPTMDRYLGSPAVAASMPLPTGTLATLKRKLPPGSEPAQGKYRGKSTKGGSGFNKQNFANAGQEEHRRRQKDEKEKKTNEMIEASYKWQSAPRGYDSPRGIFKERNRKQQTLFITKSTGDDGKAVWKAFDEYRTKFDLNSQYTTLDVFHTIPAEPSAKRAKNLATLRKESEDDKDETKSFSISGPQMRGVLIDGVDEKATIRYNVFNNAKLTEDQVTAKNIISSFGEQLRMSEMPNDIAQQVIKFSKLTENGDTQENNSGLTMFSFLVREKQYWANTPSMSGHIKEYRNNSTMVAWVKVTSVVFEPCLELFQKQMTHIVNLGVLPFYSAPSNRNVFIEMLNDKEMVPTQRWMQIVDEETGKITGTAQHDPLLKYEHNKMYRDIHSIAILQEEECKEETYAACFGPLHRHSATVMEVKDNIIYLDVILHLDDGVSPQPFAMQQVVFISPVSPPEAIEQTVTTVASPDDSGDVEMTIAPDLTAAPATPPTYRAEVVEHDAANGDFALVLTSDNRFNFEQGVGFDFTLTVQASTVVAARQLCALLHQMKTIAEGESGHDLQNALFGRTRPLTEEHDNWADPAVVDGQVLELLNRYRSATNLNESQRGFVDSAMTKVLTLGVGPPGTGKTKTLSATANELGLLGKNVLAAAPTNTAVRNLFEGFLRDQDTIRDLDEYAVARSSVLYFPTLAWTKYHLLNSHSHAPGTFFWQAFVAMKRADCNNVEQSEGVRAAAREWCGWHSIIQSTGSLNQDQEEKYLDALDKEWMRVFDEAKDPLITVTTTNNAHLLRKLKWKADFVIIDEAAYAAEAESMIALTQGGAMRAALSGDHNQLRPRRSGNKEYSRTYGLSLFERLIKNGTEAHSLQINYRMHERIATFPAWSIYGFLGCGENTYAETESFLAIDEFYKSPAMEWARNHRRQGLDHNATKIGDCRRLCFNSNGSRSAAEPGKHSLRNFGNINVITALCQGIYAHRGKYQFKPEDLTILTAYKSDADELRNHVNARVADWQSFMQTIDAMQGGENHMIICAFTPAHEHYGSKIQFLRDVHRLCVAITRAKSVLWLVGNFDAWHSEIEILAADNATKKWALLMADLMDLGDIIDVWPRKEGQPPAKEANFLPALHPDPSLSEADKPSERWTREIEHTQHGPRTLKTPLLQKIAASQSEPGRQKCVRKLLAEVRNKRKEYLVRNAECREIERLKRGDTGADQEAADAGADADADKDLDVDMMDEEKTVDELEELTTKVGKLGGQRTAAADMEETNEDEDIPTVD